MKTDRLGGGYSRVRPRRLALAAFILAVASCATQNPKPFQPQIDATKIVERNAKDTLDVFFTKADTPALRLFQDRIATARTRQDLVQAWVGVPALNAKGSDFLERHVFDKAVQEEKWAKPLSQSEAEAAFVDGVRQAVDAFLANGTP